MAIPFFAYLLVAFLPVAICQTISEAICTDRSLDWSFNSAGHSSCEVAADLAGVCNGGVFTLTPLDPGFSYLGPTAFNQNSCRCSSVYYSLLSACAACQGEQWIDWTIYKRNCSEVYISRFLQPIPDGTIVPGWAYADITATGGTFNLTVAQSLENRPESTGVASSTSTRGRPSSTSVAPSSGADGSESSSNAGAIAGGVVGGVVGLTLVAGLVFFYIRHRRLAATQQSASSAFTTTSYTPAPDDAAGSKMTQSGFSSPMPPFQPQRLYDPSDPSTFPTPSPHAPDSYSPVPFQGSNTHVVQDSMSSMPTSLPQPMGNYRGAPEL